MEHMTATDDPPPHAAPTRHPQACAAERRRPGLYILGVAGGVWGALLGGGTGTITVPGMDRLTDLRRATIHGTATLTNVAVAVIGSLVYALRGGAVDFTTGMPLMVGGVVGALFGVRLVTRLPEWVLRVVFVVVLTLSGAKLLLDALGLDPAGGAALLPERVRGSLGWVLVLALLLGLLVGAYSSAMGLGGGLLTVPLLVLLFGTTLHVAEGTSLAVMIPNSLAGSVAHLRQRTASVPVGRQLALGAVPGAVLGALLALALHSRSLGLVFGCFTLSMATREALRMRRARRTRNGPAG